MWVFFLLCDSAGNISLSSVVRQDPLRQFNLEMGAGDFTGEKGSAEKLLVWVFLVRSLCDYH